MKMRVIEQIRTCCVYEILFIMSSEGLPWPRWFRRDFTLLQRTIRSEVMKQLGKMSTQDGDGDYCHHQHPHCEADTVEQMGTCLM